jgi:mannose-6-phosphate isomerase-like protein (cupin superfamily)
MADMELKNLSKPDELRELPNTKIEVVNLGGVTVMRATFQPGWKWSKCVKPTVGTNSCEVSHVNYIISGHIMVAMDNGSQKEMGPGDVAVIPPGHDAWVVGDEPCVAIDFSAGTLYGKA